MEREVGEALPVPAHLLPLPASTRLLLPCPQPHARGCDLSGSLFGVSYLWPSPHPAPMERSEMSFSALPGGIKGVSRDSAVESVPISLSPRWVLRSVVMCVRVCESERRENGVKMDLAVKYTKLN